MSATPLRARVDSAPQSYPVGTVLVTSSPAVGVLVEAQQRRLIATRDILAGESIFSLVGRETRVATRYSIQVGPEMHLDSDDLATDEARVRERFWMYLNHSCEPSAWVRGLSVIALHDIAAGEGVTFDYNTTEWDMAEPFSCGCGTRACAGIVQGYKHVNQEARVRLREYLAEYLR
jgi:SET domain